MTTWSFRGALEELEVKSHFDELMLRSNVGLYLGDIRFTEIQTSIKICAVHFSTFIRFIEQGCFNADNLPIDGCSQTTAILLAFIPDRHLEDIKSIGIGNVIQRCGSPIGDLSSIKMVIDSICSVLTTKCKKSPMKCRVYMVFIGNYGRHMAFATDPPYCVVYSVDYKTNDPSQMTPHHTQNHMYAMVSTNMIVRRLLSLPHCEPEDRRQTKGGCLLIPRGMQFGPTLFPEIVVPHNHAGPPVNPVTWQEALFQTVGPFQAIDTIFPSFPGGLELFTAEEVVKLKELGVLNPPNAPERPLRFPPLVSSSQGKIVSAVLGMPPPGFEAHGIEQSLMTDRDKESILSDSYSDCQSITVDSGTTWGGPLYESWRENQNHRPQNARTKIATSLVKGTVTKIAKGIGIGPKRTTTDVFQNGLMGILCDAETMKVITPVMVNVRDQIRVHPTATKPSRDAEASVHHATVKSCTLLRVDLCRLHPCSTQLLYQHCTDCLLTSRNPALHICPSIRVRAHFLPSIWGEATPIPSHPRAHLSRQAPVCHRSITICIHPHHEFLQRSHQANIVSLVKGNI